ncbi:universal stress protein, partial [bacterium AH-315-D21]|nr:universal stress protein [bacterium AH-315-D21]
MFKKILIPLDGSDHSLKIVGWATGLARVLEAQIILLSVVDRDEIETLWTVANGPGLRTRSEEDGSAGRASVITPTNVIDNAVSLANKRLLSEAEKVKASGIDVSVHVEYGSPAEVIVAQAHMLGIDLIAMATRRESALARGILGSVTDRVLHSTSTPVLTLYPGELDSFGDGNGPPKCVVVPLDGSVLSESAIAPAIEIARKAGADIVFTETVRLLFY